jgi:hypothetical protein
MKFSFWKKTDSDFGRFAFVDLITKNGRNLHDNGFRDQNGNSMNPSIAHGTTGAGWEQFTCQFGDGILLGDTITGIVITYEHVGIGTYSAYFDDFLIEDGNDNPTAIRTAENIGRIVIAYPNPSKGLFNLKLNVNGEYLISVYDSSGSLIINRKSTDSNDRIELNNYPSGIYVLRIIVNSKTYIQKLVKY